MDKHESINPRPSHERCPTHRAVRIAAKRIKVAWKVLRYGEFGLRPIGHTFTSTSGSFITPWVTCQRCGMNVDVRKSSEPCPAHPQKVKVVA